MSATTRRNGNTERQIRAAPSGAIFVWCNERADYPRRMAKWLGRTDLVITTPRRLALEGYAGQPVPIVLDHATILSPRELDGIDRHNDAVKRRVRA